MSCCCCGSSDLLSISSYQGTHLSMESYQVACPKVYPPSVCLYPGITAGSPDDPRLLGLVFEVMCGLAVCCACVLVGPVTGLRRGAFWPLAADAGWSSARLGPSNVRGLSLLCTADARLTAAASSRTAKQTEFLSMLFLCERLAVRIYRSNGSVKLLLTDSARGEQMK